MTNSFNKKLESQSDKILFDARNDYIGRIDFIKLTEKLLKEETEYGMAQSPKTWLQNTRKVLSEHEFITSTAKLLRGVQVEEQLKSLETLIKEVK